MLEIIPREGSFPDLNIIEQASVARRASVGPRGCVGLEPELAETWALRQYPEGGGLRSLEHQEIIRHNQAPSGSMLTELSGLRP